MVTNLCYKSSYLRLIQTHFHKRICTFSYFSSSYKFDCNRRYWMYRMGVLKRKNNSLQITVHPRGIYLQVQAYMGQTLLHTMYISSLPLLQPILFFASSNPALQEQVYNLSFLLQIWLHPPLFRRSQGCTEIRKHQDRMLKTIDLRGRIFG